MNNISLKAKALALGLALLIAVPVFASNKFDGAECFKGTSTGQKKDSQSVKGSLSFNTETKTVEFLDKKKSPALSIKYDAIKSLLYEKTSKPRYAEAVLISPLFLFAHSTKHYLTIQYTDQAGASQYAIVRLDKKNAQQAVAAAESETGKSVERAVEK